MRPRRTLAALLLLGTLPPALARGQSAPVAPDGAVAYDVDGLRIIHRRTSARTFAANLYLLGGARQVTAANAGIEPLLLRASEYGTTDHPGAATRRATARTGSTISVEEDLDWTTFSMSGARDEFDATWSVFTSRLLRPTLDTSGVDLVRRRMLAAVRRQRSSPDAHAMVLAESLAFVGHPYAVSPSGSETSLTTLTPADLRAYAAEQLVKSRMLLVVVGDIPREHLDSLVTASIGTLPRGTYRWTMPPPVRSTAAAVTAAHRPAATNYLAGYIHGPQVSSDEYPAFQYAMMILNNFVSDVIREREGLSYAANVALFERGVTGAALFVSTNRPDSVAKLINFIFDAYEDDVRIPGGAFKRAAESFRTEYLFGMETASSHADMLARAMLYLGDFRAAGTRNEVMAKVRFPEVRQIIKTYGRNIQYAFVGDTIRLPRATLLKR